MTKLGKAGSALVVVITLLPNPVAACSFTAPMDFDGYAVLADLASGRRRTVPFDEVSIGSDCGITNAMDVEGGVALVELHSAVRLFTLDSDVGEITLPGRYPAVPVLDGEFIVYIDGDDNSSLRRLRRGTSEMEILLVFNASKSAPWRFSVVDGLALWGGREGQVSLFDTNTRTLVLDEVRVTPTNLTYFPVGLDARRITFIGYGPDLHGTLVMTFDWTTNETTEVAVLPESVDWAYSLGANLAQDDDRLVYVWEGLHVLNLTTRVITDLPQLVEGRNLAAEGSLIVYDYYEGTRLWGPWEWLCAGFVALFFTVIAAAYVLRKRRRRPPANT